MSRLLVAPRARERSRSWVEGYIARLAWSDALIVAGAVMAGQWVRFGPSSSHVPNGSSLSAGVVSALLIIVWILWLRIFHASDRRIIGSGSQEYSRITTACLSVFGLLAMVDLLFKLNIARGFLVIAFPVGTVALLLSRWLWRRRLIAQRL
ncbi:sugar transferase, partial [Streptomyces sp. SID10244]|nr:sugar transferase [Streptomyces sp. SID10244]